MYPPPSNQTVPQIPPASLYCRDRRRLSKTLRFWPKRCQL